MGGLKTANEFDRQRTLRLIKQLVDAGYIRNILFSHDVCYTTDYATYGGSGYSFLSSGAFAVLNAEIGLQEEQFATIMYENPRRMLTGEG